MRGWAVLAGALLAASCGPSAEEKAAQDARDVAQVEATQKIQPPVQPLNPQAMAADALAADRITREGCWFVPAGSAASDPVLIVGRDRALLVIDGVPTVLAADSGSPAIGAFAYEKYSGKTHWAALTHGDQASGPDHWPASLAIRDRYERIVYFSAGELDCERRDEPAPAAPSS